MPLKTVCPMLASSRPLMAATSRPFLATTHASSCSRRPKSVSVKISFPKFGEKHMRSRKILDDAESLDGLFSYIVMKMRHSWVEGNWPFWWYGMAMILGPSRREIHFTFFLRPDTMSNAMWIHCVVATFYNFYFPYATFFFSEIVRCFSTRPPITP